MQTENWCKPFAYVTYSRLHLVTSVDAVDVLGWAAPGTEHRSSLNSLYSPVTETAMYLSKFDSVSVPVMYVRVRVLCFERTVYKG
jgi:hypothetical protein